MSFMGLDTSRLSSKSLIKRSLSAAILIPLSLGLVYLGGLYFSIFLFVLAAGVFYEWLSVAAKTSEPLKHKIFGAVYLFIGFLSFYLIRENYGFMTSILLMVLIWSSDIGAYFTGKFTGGPKFLESVSPNKTWAGFVGAMVFPALIVILFYVFLHPPMGERNLVLDVIFSGVAGGIIGALGQMGDLLVSVLKRRAKVKDTGNLIPGHGGILDRMDSLLLAGPFYLLLISYLMS